ncbi:MAG: tetratricopeptide repeat protein [Balneolales bacterium]
MKVLTVALISCLAFASCSASGEVQQSSGNCNSEGRQDVAGALHEEPSAEALIEAQSLYIKGITQFEIGDYEHAVDYLKLAKSLHPGSFGINYALLDAYLELEDLTNAVYYGQKAVEIMPDNKWNRLKLSDAFRRLGKIDDSLDELNAILKVNPNDLDVLFLIASVKSNQGRYEESNETYEKILNLRGSERSVHYQRFQNFTSLGDSDAAIDELEQIRKLSPGNLRTLHTLSQFYLESNQPGEAKEVLEDAMQRNPRDPETLISLSDIYINEGDWQTGGEIMNSIVADPLVGEMDKVELVQYMLSKSAQEQGNEKYFETVQTMVETMVDKNSDFGLSHALAAEYYSMIEDYNRALVHLERTTKLMPNNEIAWKQRLQFLQMQSRHEETIEVGLQADEKVPDDATIQFFLGGAYFLSDDNENAIKWLKSASEMPARAPLKSVILGTLGDSYASTEKWEPANEAYENAIRYDSENDVTLNNYAYYLAEQNERINEAKDMAKKALSINPDNSTYLDTLGYIFFKLEEYEKAKEYIESSLNAGSTSAEVMEHMGDVYEKLGDLEKAAHWWRKALEEDDSRTHLQEKLS